ncbi:MAG: ATP-dependent helicase [Treponema sp.]|jgi:DNA helicase-2/ATP-dependent DNA helicase PcrA|nr:ATP-dependent helicase [Treponema sp.]
MSGAIPNYLDVLNGEQREAVLHGGNSEAGTHPLLILAGAGSGKTRVITTKIAYLIREQGMDPRSILAVTFTNKAAREMAERARLIDPRAGDAMMRTFHSFGAWFLRRNADLAGLSSGFVIYDDDDAVSLLGTIIPDVPRQELKATAALISRAKDYFLSPNDPELDQIDYRPEFRKDYTRYEERLAKIGNVDFGDLIKKPVEILRSRPDLARRFHERFRVVMVDEYQDSNIAQFRLLSELAGPETYLCVVGDDDQSIYRFRGAEVKNILEFPERFSGTDIIRLERNYRSFTPILKLASSVVDHNTGRLGKTLRAERGNGKLPTLAFLPDQDEEAAFCAELIDRSVRMPEKNGRAKDSRTRDGPAMYSDWAILYRTNAQSLGFETELLRRRIPYQVVGSLKFYEREEIKDALALLALLMNPRDEVAFRRIINKPARGIGEKTLDAIMEAAYAAPPASGLSGLIGTANNLSLSAKAAAGIKAFAGFMEKARTLLAPGTKGIKPAKAAGPESPGPKNSAQESPGPKNPARGNPADSGAAIRAGEGLSICTAALIVDSGLAEYHSSHDEINGYQRIGNLQELVNAASLYPSSMEGLAEFMEHIELDRSLETDQKTESHPNSVTLITLHNTKGLEFKRVILTGLEQGIFPRDDKEGDDLEEERRLFYVGATRAMDELYLCSCALRRMYGRTIPTTPSLFLREADQTVLRVIGDVPPGFGSGRRAGSAVGGGYGGAYPYNRSFEHAPSGGAGFGPEQVSSDGRWKRGDRVFHDDQGYGAVADIAEEEDGPVIRVRFDNGQETRFLSRYQGRAFTKIGTDHV